ncbi:MAG: ribosome assembly cofactor RimP [Muribaculaceae bacterium]
MIDNKALKAVIEAGLQDTDMFLVDIIINPSNAIVVEIDSTSGVSIEECIRLTKLVEENFDRDKEDYELEIGSAGLTSPFKVKAQYDKNLGNEVEVLTGDGRKLKATLKSTTDNDFTVTTTKKVKIDGAKRPTEVQEDETFKYSEIKYTKYLMQFK